MDARAHGEHFAAPSISIKSPAWQVHPCLDKSACQGSPRALPPVPRAGVLVRG